MVEIIDRTVQKVEILFHVLEHSNVLGLNQEFKHCFSSRVVGQEYHIWCRFKLGFRED